jgi:hypothetical protein
MPDKKIKHEKRARVRAAKAARAAQERSIVQKMQDAIFRSKHRSN